MVVGGSFLSRFLEGAVSLVVEPLSSKGAFFDSERKTRPVRVLEKVGAFSEVRGEKDASATGVLRENRDTVGSSTGKSDGPISRPDRVLRGPSSFPVYT